jgi:hypothetical protein
MEKKNRGALYRVIARVLGKLSDDAQRAFKAHFPYLADEIKLDEHSKALYIPHLDDDSIEEFRNRVATASFFLSRAGERGYILEQLRAHFGDRFTCGEEFLKLFVKIADLSDKDRKWVLEFLDAILDPVIFLSVAEWFLFVEQVETNDQKLTSRLRINTRETFGRVKYNGKFKYHGAVKYNAKGIHDKFSSALTTDTQDAVQIQDIHFSVSTRIRHKYDKKYKYNEAIKYNSGTVIPIG